MQNDIITIYRAICQTFGASRYLIFLLVVITTVILVIPNTPSISKLYHLKEEVVLNSAQGLNNLMSKLGASKEEGLIIDHYKNELEKTKAQLINTQLRLKELEDLQSFVNYLPTQFKFYSSKIIKVDQTPLMNVAYITGGHDKLKVGDVVINNSTIIGRIIETYENASKVLLSYDPQFKIPVMGEKTKNQYIVTGIGRKNILELEFIGYNSSLVEEEMLVTSGEGGLFPQGLKVGELHSNQNKYVVKRHMDFAKNPYVFVVR